MRLSESHRERRKQGFNRFYTEHEHVRKRVLRVTASQQGGIHDAVKLAYNAGYANGVAQERREQAPITVGGMY